MAKRKPTTNSLLLIIINKINWNKAISVLAAIFTPIVTALVLWIQVGLKEHHVEEDAKQVKAAVVDSSWKVYRRHQDSVLTANQVQLIKDDSIIISLLKPKTQ